MTIKHFKLIILAFLAFIMIAVTTIIAFAAKDQPVTVETESEPEPDFPQHIEDIAQTHFNNSENVDNAMQILPEEKLRELEGHINKEYGIREDVLRFIEKEIPAENEKAKHAAIRYAETMNFIYYHANQKEALEAMSKEYLALRCLSLFLNDFYIQFTKNIESIMRNTTERDEHMWDIDKRFFGWKVIKGHGLSDKKEKEVCESGDY
jgi:hypothetical protein